MNYDKNKLDIAFQKRVDINQKKDDELEAMCSDGYYGDTEFQDELERFEVNWKEMTDYQCTQKDIHYQFEDWLTYFQSINHEIQSQEDTCLILHNGLLNNSYLYHNLQFASQITKWGKLT